MTAFCHIPLPAFVDALLDYLRTPYRTLRHELLSCEDRWLETEHPSWLIRLGHLQEGLGHLSAAVRTYRHGAARFPYRPDFPRLHARAQVRLEQLACRSSAVGVRACRSPRRR